VQLSRRGFFGGLLAIVSTPAIVRVENLMKLAPLRVIHPIVGWDLAYGADVTRLDVLYGSMRMRSELTAIVPDFPISIDKYSERILASMINQLAESVTDAVMHDNDTAWATLEADGTGTLPKGAREQVPVIVSIRLSDLLREAQGHQFA